MNTQLINMKHPGIVLSVFALMAMISCKKDTTDDSVNGRLQGNWIESSARQVSLVVSTPPAGDENLPNLRLISGTTTYFFQYRLNNAGDSMYISDLSTGGPKNIPYKIAFSGDGRALTIKKFHTILPNVDPLTFDKQ